MRVLTPGTLTDEALLDDRSDSLLAAISRLGNEFGLATLDMSSGQFQVMEVNSQEELHSELQRLNPVETLIPEDLSGLDFLENRVGVRRRGPWEFDLETAQRQLNKHFATHDLTGFGCSHLILGIGAAGCLLQYARDTQRSNLPHIRAITAENRDHAVILDPSTRRNLELNTNLSGGSENTLFQVLDTTAMTMASPVSYTHLTLPTI